MKKTICLILAVIMICASFASCSSLEENDKGSIVTMYLANQVFDFDPIVDYTDTSKARILSLVFEGLTTLDKNGNWQNGMMDSYEYIKPSGKNSYYKLRIQLDESKWSDGRTVQANDFVYAWKRIMEPSVKCDAASLLYEVRNAYDVKMGDVTIDDLGVYAIETYKLEVEFDHDIDIDEFFRNCASVALVPLREDKVSTDNDWAKRASSMVTNGPFDIRKIVYGEQLSLERSSYYRRDTESDEALDKYVIPYRLVIYYSYGTNYDQAVAFDNGDIFYLDEIALEARETYKDEAEIYDSAVTAAFYFNTNNKLFENADVRRALSLALDRQAIADAIVFAKPASGFIPHNVFNYGDNDSFREEGGDILSTGADLDEAKSLLKSAGKTGGSFKITVRDNEVDNKIAELAAEAWGELGFTVKIDIPGTKKSNKVAANQSMIYDDLYQEALDNGEFDVAFVDYNMLSSNAFSALAGFATDFSGNGVDMESENYDVLGHFTGYKSESYDAKIKEAFDEKDQEKRAALLHEAETILLEDAPVAPVLFLQDAYVVSGELSGISDTYWGRDFRDLKMDNYMEYKESIVEANETEDIANND